MNSFLNTFFTFLILMSSLIITSCHEIKLEKKRLNPDLKRSNTINFPKFEKNAIDIEKNYQIIRSEGEKELAQMKNEINNLPENQITYQNTFYRFELLQYKLSTFTERVHFLDAVTKDQTLREKAIEIFQKMENLLVDIAADEEIYLLLNKAIKHIDIKSLTMEENRVIENMMREYKRLGFELSKEKRQELLSLLKKQSEIANEAAANVDKSNNTPLYFKFEELKGVPENILQSLEKDTSGNYIIRAGMAYQTGQILEYAKIEETRKKTLQGLNSLAKENEEVLAKLFKTRAETATLLGYKNWSDYVLETLMIKSNKNANDFLNSLSLKIDKPFQEMIEELRTYKVKETNNPNAKIESWDKDYFAHMRKEDTFKINFNELSEYFVTNRVMQAMFDIYSEIFDIKISYVDIPYKWDDEVKAIKIEDLKTNELLGLVYLDLYPRPETNKFGHFAVFDLNNGIINESGIFEHPTCSLVCNFPKPTKDRPSLLSLDNVRSLFHEFGHALHYVFSRAVHPSLAGLNVARDFVEAPSQMLENWAYDAKVISLFGVHYKDESKKIPLETIEKIDASIKSDLVLKYKAQIAYALLDLKLHELSPEDNVSPIKLSNEIIAKTYLPYPEESHFVTKFKHIMRGYDSKYYGYIWAKLIATDMASLFMNAPNKFFDKEIGLKLKHEVYEYGSARDENVSVESFLDRKISDEAFVKILLSH